MKRLFFVGGNWKMNGLREQVKQLVHEMNNAQLNLKHQAEVVVFPPFLSIEHVQNTIRPEFQVGAQNCYCEPKGAFTGEISADMLIDHSIPWVILGHSERRDIFKESDELVGRKVGYALGVGLKVIACIGEHLDERESGKTNEVVHRQLKSIADQVKESQWKNLVIAYEPVWAIGTGKTATPLMAQEVHGSIRGWLSNHISSQVADSTRILYGGSVKASLSDDLAKQPDIDGFLVGGASLISSEFISIISSAKVK